MSEEERNQTGTPEDGSDLPSNDGDDSGWEHFNWQEGFFSWDPEDAAGNGPAAQPLGNVYQDAPPPPPPEPPEPQSPEASPKVRKKHRLSLSESILAAILYVAGVLVISFLLATVGWRWANDLLALDKTEKTVSITITSGDTIDDLAETLRANGLIEYKFLFETFAAFTNKVDKITTGTYELNTEMDYSALLNNISSTSVYRETVTVTIPEGYTTQEAFALLEESGVCSAADLTASAESDTFDFPFLKDVKRTGIARLEGYLFPDTYEFYKGADAKSVITRMLTNFSGRFDAEMEAERQLLGRSTDEILIIASIIEKETTGEDRNDIASVIYNRLETPDYEDIDGCLQMDSTVQYLLQERKEHLTNEDISIDSPYNTYVYPGLPEGPICNPGLTSIQAALEPSSTDYFYFMLGDDKEDHFFTTREGFDSFRTAQSSYQGGEEDDGDAE